MLAGVSVDDVRAGVQLRHNTDEGISYLPDREAAKFLVARGFTYGLMIKGVGNWTDDFTINNLKSVPALLGVKSPTNPKWEHAVVWDAEIQLVRDPLWPAPQPLGNYEVHEWIPIHKIVLMYDESKWPVEAVA